MSCCPRCAYYTQKLFFHLQSFHVYGLFSQQAHTTGLTELRFTLAFVHCVMELASSKDQGACVISSPDVSLLEQSLVTDQISLLNREWR